MADVTTTSIEALREEILRLRDSKIEAANAEADRALSALGIVSDALQGEARIESDDAGTDTPTVPRWSEPKRGLPTATWVAEIVNSLNGSSITQPVVYERLMAQHAADFADRDASSIKGQIAMILKKMELKGDLVIHKEAHGTDPKEYRRRTVAKEVPVQAQPAKDGGSEWE